MTPDEARTQNFLGAQTPQSPADRKRREIIDRSADLFDEYGYRDTSMNDIADAVGVRKPTLYHYFKNKDEILYWIHEEFINGLVEAQEARVAAALPPEQIVREVMAEVLTLMQTHRGHVRTYFEHHRELDEQARAESLEKRLRYRRLLQDAISRGIDDGAFRAVDPALTALAVFGMVNWAYQWYQVDGPRTPDDIANQFADLLLGGLRA
jgi:AcrR family transcriptional regulator